MKINSLIVFFTAFLPLCAESHHQYALSVCAVFQNEEFFLKEWIEYHKLIGVEHFYLYDNLSTDRSNEILRPYILSGTVDLIDWPVETRNQNEYLDLLQLPVYNHALEIAKKETDWIAFIDVDEFILPTRHRNLIDFLNEYKSYPGLAINWQIYGTSWLERIEDNGLITENLVLKAPTDHSCNQLIKMIVQPQYVETIPNPHFFKFYDGYCARDSSGTILPFGTMGQPVNVEDIRINHYWCGTHEWLMSQKIPRREKWGFVIPDDLLTEIITSYNQVYDNTILKFVPDLKVAMQLTEKYYGYPIIQYELIDFDSIQEVKAAIGGNGGSRKVYYDDKNNLFIKIWSEDYPESRNFQQALMNHYYDDLAPLAGIVFDSNSMCRGYATYGLHQNPTLFYCNNRYGYLCLETAEKQSSGYQIFYKKLLERSLTTGFYHIDLVPSNLAQDDEQYYLIDLEPLLQVDELKKIKETSLSRWLHLVEHLPLDYAFFILSLTNKN